MTCIVGIEKNGKVYLAGDTQGTGATSKSCMIQPKVYKAGGLIIGYAGSYRYGQLIEAYLGKPAIPRDGESVYKWLLTTIIPQIRKILEDHGYLGEDDESLSQTGGDCLIGVKGELWEIAEDFSLLRSTLGYASIGSGSEYAMAATEALRTRVKSPQTLLREVMSIVHLHCPSVGNKATILHT